MKKFIIVIFVLLGSTSYGGIINSQYSLSQALENGRQLAPSHAVAMLEGGAPTGTLIHPLVVLTCAHSTHIPGEVVKFIDRDGSASFLSHVKHALIPAEYHKATKAMLVHYNKMYMNQIKETVAKYLYQSHLSLSFIKFGVERGLRLLQQQKGSMILDERESESDIQLLFLTTAVPQYIARPVYIATEMPDLAKPLHAISYGPIYGQGGALRPMNRMAQDGPYLRHSFTSFAFGHNGKVLCTKFLTIPMTPLNLGIDQLGSIVPGDSGSPVFVFDANQNEWVLQGLNVASYNVGCQYIPGVQATICDVSHHVNWIKTQLDENLARNDQELAYAPQLVLDQNSSCKVDLVDQISGSHLRKDSFPNQDARHYVNFDHAINTIIHATVTFDRLEKEKHMVVLDELAAPQKAVKASSREDHTLVIDWFVNLQPDSVEVSVMKNGLQKASGSFGGTMAQIKLPFGKYDIALQFRGKTQGIRFAYMHAIPIREATSQKWLSLTKLISKEILYEGWVDNGKGLNFSDLDDGVYQLAMGATTMPEKGKVIFVNHEFLPDGYISVEADPRYPNLIQLNLHGCERDINGQISPLSLSVFRRESGQLFYTNYMQTTREIIELPWGPYNLTIRLGNQTLTIPYDHYRHAVLEGNIKTIIDASSSRLEYVSCSYGECHSVDLSLMRNGNYHIYVDQGGGRLKRFYALVASNKFPAHVALTDLAFENAQFLKLAGLTRVASNGVMSSENKAQFYPTSIPLTFELY